MSLQTEMSIASPNVVKYDSMPDQGKITMSTPKIKILLTVTVSAVSVSRTHAISRSQLSPIMEVKSFILTAVAEGAK